jgi:hypothetical protein
MQSRCEAHVTVLQQQPQNPNQTLSVGEVQPGVAKIIINKIQTGPGQAAVLPLSRRFTQLIGFCSPENARWYRSV